MDTQSVKTINQAVLKALNADDQLMGCTRVVITLTPNMLPTIEATMLISNGRDIETHTKRFTLVAVEPDGCVSKGEGG